MTRVAKVAAIVVVAAVGLAVACGGRLGLDGSLDDAGVFRRPDGEVVFGPGSFCRSEAGAVYEHRPFCDRDASNVDNHTRCNVWWRENFPFPASSDCDMEDAGLRCVPDFFPQEPCPVGSVGDAYCAAYYQQFVLGDARAQAQCSPRCGSDNCEGKPGHCVPAVCDCQQRLCVERAGIIACEDLCR